jgi:hypothetical protein
MSFVSCKLHKIFVEIKGDQIAGACMREIRNAHRI